MVDESKKCTGEVRVTKYWPCPDSTCEINWTDKEESESPEHKSVKHTHESKVYVKPNKYTDKVEVPAMKPCN